LIKIVALPHINFKCNIVIVVELTVKLLKYNLFTASSNQY